MTVAFLIGTLIGVALVCLVAGYMLTHPSKRGPLVICVDKSGSMVGKCEAWAYEFCRALVVGVEGKRDVHLLYFDHQLHHHQFLPKGRGDLMPPPMAYGDTNYMKVLGSALGLCEVDRKFRRPSIVMVTDDLSTRVDKEWLVSFEKLRRKLHVRVNVVYVGYAAAVRGDITDRFPFADEVERASVDAEFINGPLFVGALMAGKVR